MNFNKNTSRETATLSRLYLPLPLQKFTAKRLVLASAAAEVHRGIPVTRPVRSACAVLRIQFRSSIRSFVRVDTWSKTHARSLSLPHTYTIHSTCL